MPSGSNSETRFGILSSWRIFLTSKLRKKMIFYYFLAPYSISKTSVSLRGSLHFTDGAKISYTVFWYRGTTFEILTPKT